MKITIKKYIPQLIGLLLIIAILVVVYFTFIKKENIGTIYVPNDEIIDTSLINEVDESTAYIRSIPKQSQSSENYLFYQSITGDGNTFYKNLFKTSVGNYIVCESDCENGDLQSDKYSVGVALLDDLANISEIFIIPSKYSNYYVESQITPVGIVIITTNALKEVYYVNIVSYELDSITTLIINHADNAIIYPTVDAFLIIAEYVEENIIYQYNDCKLSFSGIMAGNVVELYEFGTYYTLFCNTVNGYTIANIGKSNLTTISETFINGFSLISVTPINEENLQKFILLETNGTVYARKMKKLDNTDSVVSKLGTFTLEDICAGDNCLVMVCSGRLSGLIYLNYDLTCQYSESNSNYWITSILDHNYVNGIYYYLTVNSSFELILITQYGNTTNAKTIANNCQNAGFVFQQNNTVMITYQINIDGVKKVEIVGLV